MAARSLRLTASARWPTRQAASRAESAPPQPRIDRGYELRAGRTLEQRGIIADTQRTSERIAPALRKYRSISANSDSGHALAQCLVRPQRARRPIEHRVDELVAVGGAEAFREAHRLVDGDTIGHLGPAM